MTIFGPAGLGADGSARSAAWATRQQRDAERELNDVLRDRQRLIQANDTAQERYERRIGETTAIALRAADAGNPVRHLPASALGG